MAVRTEYGGFLDEAGRLLNADGARYLVAPAGPRSADLDGWDLIMALDGPGVARVYAFTGVDGVEAPDVSRRITGLARALASGNTGVAGLEVIAVLVSTFPLAPDRLGALRRASPTVYFPGLRPSTWVADLANRTVSAGSRFRRPEGVEILEAAVRGEADGGAEERASVQPEHAGRQLHAFYSLMRGRQPYVTYALIAINTALFALLAAQAGLASVLYQNSGPSAATMKDLGALSPALVQQGEWWRLCTAMFLHASVPHILFNMLSLLAVGTLAERLYGSLRFLGIYLGAGLIGNLASVGFGIVTGNVDGLAVGASGAIFGVAGALVTVRYQRSDVIPERLRRRVSSAILPLVLISLVFAALTPYVDNSAHIGGLLGGMALSFALPLTRTAPEPAR